jgi:hypothetical protein
MSGDGWKVNFFSLFGPPFDYSPGRCDPAHVDSGEKLEWHEVRDLPAAVIPNLHWLIPLVFDPDLAFPVEIRDKSNPEVNGATVKG